MAPHSPIVRAVNCVQNTLASAYISLQEYSLTSIYVLRHIRTRHDGNPAGAGRTQSLSNRRTLARRTPPRRRHGPAPGPPPAASLETSARAQRCRAGGRARGRAAPDLCITPGAAEGAGSLDRTLPADLGREFSAARWRAARTESEGEKTWTHNAVKLQ